MTADDPVTGRGFLTERQYRTDENLVARQSIELDGAIGASARRSRVDDPRSGCSSALTS